MLYSVESSRGPRFYRIDKTCQQGLVGGLFVSHRMPRWAHIPYIRHHNSVSNNRELLRHGIRDRIGDVKTRLDMHASFLYYFFSSEANGVGFAATNSSSAVIRKRMQTDVGTELGSFARTECPLEFFWVLCKHWWQPT